MATWQELNGQWVMTDPRTAAERALPYVPDRLLYPSPNPTKHGKHQAQLLAWLAKHGVSPTLAELEAERARRRAG